MFRLKGLMGPFLLCSTTPIDAENEKHRAPHGPHEAPLDFLWALSGSHGFYTVPMYLIRLLCAIQGPYGPYEALMGPSRAL